jgi:hypothetical protein
MMILKFECLAFTFMGNVRSKVIDRPNGLNDNEFLINELRPSTLMSPSSKYSIL